MAELNPARIVGSVHTNDQIPVLHGQCEQDVADILGFPTATPIANPCFAGTASGVDEMILQDAGLGATAAGRLRRNGALLTWHDGTSVQTLLTEGGSATFNDLTVTLDADIQRDLRVAEEVYFGAIASNAHQSIGATISGNTTLSDEENLTLKHESLAHGVTNKVTWGTETTTYFYAGPLNRQNGGTRMQSIAATGSIGMVIGASAPTTTSTKSATAGAALILDGMAQDLPDPDHIPMTSTDNVAAVRSYNVNTAIFTANGDIYLSGQSRQNQWDDYDDIRLLTAYRALQAPSESPFRQRFHAWIKESREILEETGVIARNPDSIGPAYYVSLANVQGLIIGSSR